MSWTPGQDVPSPRATTGRPWVIDVHCHFTLTARPWHEESPFAFERGPAVPFAAYNSPRHLNRLGQRLARRWIGRGRRLEGEALDARLETLFLRHLTTFQQADRLVLLAFDEVHDDAGRSRGPARRRGDAGTDLYVSNGFVLQMCRQHPDRFLFGASVHPYRPDALARLDAVVEAGAVLMKWLPPSHNIDAADPRAAAFLRRCHEHGLPLLVHYGPEFTLSTHSRRAEDPQPMFETLRRLRRESRMPTVIVAHVATPLLGPFTNDGAFRLLLDALTGEFADAPLYADIAALAAPSKVHGFRTILRTPAVWPKLVYGSDFPIPCTPVAFRDLLGRQYHRIAAEPNWIDRDVLLKRAVGLPDHVFTRAAGLLRVQGADTEPTIAG
jgi:hypothetical protein